MRKMIISACLVAVFLVVSGCSSSKTENSSEIETVTTAPSETSAEAVTSEPAIQDPGPESYTHSEEGYYNILDEFPDIKLKTQKGGTCWLYAGAMSMETAYAKKTGSYISIDPLEMFEYVYGDGREDGFFVKENVSAMEAGGAQWIVTAGLTNGFGGLVIDSSVILDGSDREAIKKNLHERGGVVVGMNDTKEEYKGWHGGYYTINYSIEEFDHNVTIIGYDDHFPKQYFNEPASEDGAWICYNSASSSGCLLYISYQAPLEETVSHSVTDEYSEVLSYDAGNEEKRYIKTGDSTNAANVFHKAGTLAAVGTYNDFDEQDITIEIYDADFKNLICSQDAVLDYKGYHTIRLNTPVDVTDCAVAISYSKGAPVEGEDTDIDDLLYFKSVSTSGQSFVKTDSGWKDLTDSDIKSAVGSSFEPNNCCIKALYQ